MNIKKLVAVTLSLSLVLCCVGCANNNVSDPKGSEPSIETQQTEPTESLPTDVLPTEPTGTETVKGEEFIWEKEFQKLTTKDVRLDANWDKQIVVDDIKISSKQLTDMSALPNYYYENDADSYSELETAYYVPTFMLLTSSKTSDLNDYATLQLDALSTTLNSNSDVKDLIIEELRLISQVNPYEGGLDVLQKDAYDSDGQFGIGSSYKHTTSIIGNAFEETTESMNDINWTTCIYVGDNATLILSFTWFADDDVESAVLTAIDWIAADVRAELQAQDDIHLFEGYYEFMNNASSQDSLAENTTPIDEEANADIDVNDTTGNV